MNLYVLRARLASALVRSQADTRATDPVAHSFALGRLNGLEEAIRLVEEALHEEHEAGHGPQQSASIDGTSESGLAH